MNLSQAILDAIDKTVAAVSDGTMPPQMVRQAYIAEAEAALAGGMTETQLLAKFEAMQTETAGGAE